MLPHRVPEPEPQEPEVSGPDEDAQVTGWRFLRLIEIGLPVEDAEWLAARRDVDVHRVEDLLRRGATADQAVRIVG